MKRRRFLTVCSTVLTTVGVTGCTGSDESSDSTEKTTASTTTETSNRKSITTGVTTRVDNYDDEDGDDHNIKIYNRDGEVVETLSDEKSDEVQDKIIEKAHGNDDYGSGGESDCDDYNVDGDCDGSDGVDGDEY
ncbi:hypothetical protein M0R89_15845 [Halorussus limi]|uniref:Uncharacterized protein n=1 Tax=Halorussus limi TaxID=2938695 RepID=A0A8U0HSZ0_9EURY|nr:hypothetical protein [Halorussus limi]UPV73997.1 hypothetical protein M0R89_15845 [Halorussus limi]